MFFEKCYGLQTSFESLTFLGNCGRDLLFAEKTYGFRKIKFSSSYGFLSKLRGNSQSKKLVAKIFPAEVAISYFLNEKCYELRN